MPDRGGDVLGSTRWVVQADLSELEFALSGVRVQMLAFQNGMASAEERWKTGEMLASDYDEAILTCNEGLKRLTAEEASLLQALSATTASMKVAAASVDDIGRLSQGASANISQFGGKLQDATKWTHGMDAAAQKTGKGFTQFASQTAYLADDMQYLGSQGIRPIMNNLNVLLVQLGPIGAAMAIVGVAAYALYENWRSVSSVFRTDLVDQMTGSVKELTKRMEELGKQSLLTGQEMAEMAAIKEKLAGIKFEEEQAAKPTKAGEGVIKGFQEASGQEGGGFGQLQSAIHDAVGTAFRSSPIAALREAARAGTLKDDQGKAVGFNEQAYRNDPNVRKQFDALYLASAGRDKERELAERIGKQGDVGALRELEVLLKQTGRFDIDQQGRTTNQRGEEQKGLSTLFKSDPARVKAMEEFEKHLELMGQVDDDKVEAAKKLAAFEDHLEKLGKEDDKRQGRQAEKIAKPLEESLVAKAAGANKFGGMLSRDQVKAEMRRTGSSEEEIDQYIDGVLDALQEALNDAIKKKQSEPGNAGMDRKQAAAAVAADFAAKEQKVRDAARKEAEKADAIPPEQQKAISQATNIRRGEFAKPIVAAMINAMQRGLDPNEIEPQLIAGVAAKLQNVPEAIRTAVAKAIVAFGRQRFDLTLEQLGLGQVPRGLGIGGGPPGVRRGDFGGGVGPAPNPFGFGGGGPNLGGMTAAERAKFFANQRDAFNRAQQAERDRINDFFKPKRPPRKPRRPGQQPNGRGFAPAPPANPPKKPRGAAADANDGGFRCVGVEPPAARLAADGALGPRPGDKEQSTLLQQANEKLDKANELSQQTVQLLERIQGGVPSVLQ